MGSTCGHSFLQGYVDESRHLTLRAVRMPVAPSEGASEIDIAVGHVLDVCDLATSKETEVLNWRYNVKRRDDRTQKRNTMSKDDVELPPWPSQRCFSVHQRFWRVALPDKPGCFGILQMASDPTERTLEGLDEDTAACKTIADYAHKFNKLQAAEHASDPPPAIRVASPICCQVDTSGFSSMFSVGDFLVLYILPVVQEIEKFIFNGTDSYSEVPQAFFHFVTLSSGGKDLAYDLQGIEEERNGDVFLVNPAVLKVVERKDALPVCGIVTGSEQLEWNHFQALHPTCSPLCKAFDPHRAVRLGRGFMCGC